MKQNRKEIISWALYDWANSAFATTVMAGFFPLFFKSYWASQLTPQQGTFVLGAGSSSAALLIAVTAPVMGAIADKGSAKKKMLLFFAYLGALMTFSLFFIQQGLWLPAIILYAIGNIGFSAGNLFYDSLLTSVAKKEEYDFVSSLGFAMGYIGGGLLFAVNIVMFQKPEWFMIPDPETAVRISFMMVGVWWALFSIPIMIFVKEEKNENQESVLNVMKGGFKQFIQTFNHIRKLKIIFTFLIAYWFYIDGVDTVIRMAVDYGSSLGFPGSSLIVALLMVQFIAFPGALLYQLFARKIGVKNGVLVAIGAYSFITLLGFFMKEVYQFYILAAMVGLFQGGIQALSRSIYARIIPNNKSAEFFGFFNMLGKFAAIIGPMLVGTVSLLFNSNRIGILSILILFVAGGYLLFKVDIKEGERLSEQV